MKIKLHTSLFQNILIGIFISIVSGLIVFSFTEFQHESQQITPAKPAPIVEQLNNPIYKLLLAEQQKLGHLNEQLMYKEQELFDAKEEEGFRGDFFDSAEAGRIRQEIDYLEQEIEESEDIIIKFGYELDRMSVRSKNQQYPTLSLIVMGLTFVGMVLLLTLLSIKE